MKLVGFYLLMTLLYAIGMGYLFHELRTSTAEQRLELQTVPLLLASTVFYMAVLCKTYRLAQA